MAEKCREVMNLQFLLPEVPGLGVWQIDTGSINSIRNINSASQLIKAVTGRISMIPLLLTLEKQEVQGADGKKKTVHVMNLGIKENLINLTAAVKDKKLITEYSLPENDDLGEGTVIDDSPVECPPEPVETAEAKQIKAAAKKAGEDVIAGKVNQPKVVMNEKESEAEFADFIDDATGKAVLTDIPLNEPVVEKHTEADKPSTITPGATVEPIIRHLGDLLTICNKLWKMTRADVFEEGNLDGTTASMKIESLKKAYLQIAATREQPVPVAYANEPELEDIPF